MIIMITMITITLITITLLMMMMVMMLISRIQDVRVNNRTVAPKWFLIILCKGLSVLTNQDFIPIKFGIGQRCHDCFH